MHLHRGRHTRSRRAGRGRCGPCSRRPNAGVKGMYTHDTHPMRRWQVWYTNSCTYFYIFTRFSLSGSPRHCPKQSTSLLLPPLPSPVEAPPHSPYPLFENLFPFHLLKRTCWTLPFLNAPTNAWHSPGTPWHLNYRVPAPWGCGEVRPRVDRGLGGEMEMRRGSRKERKGQRPGPKRRLSCHAQSPPR